MAHPPSSSVIFSPSVARQAASATRDWSYVDSWLRSKFGGRLPPSFERNTDTLRALLEIASFNEAADEALNALAQAEDIEPTSHPGLSWDCSANSGFDHVGANILEAVEQHMSEEIKSALDAATATASRLGIMTSADPECIGSRLIKLRAQALEQDHTQARMYIMGHDVDLKANCAIRILEVLGSRDFKLAPEAVKENLDLQRSIKTWTARLADTKELARSDDGATALDINVVVSQEMEYRQLEVEKARLDKELASFRGLSSNLEVARADLENRMHDLQVLVERRDIVFEGLVEAESPVKRRS